MGSRGQDSGNKPRQMSFEDAFERNVISSIMRDKDVKREQMSTGGVGRSSGVGSQVTKMKCACCGEYTIPVNSEYETCTVCGWIDDKFQNANPNSLIGRNPISLNEARAAYKSTITNHWVQ